MKARIAVTAGKKATTIEGRRYGYVSKIVPPKIDGIVLAGSAKSPPINGPNEAPIAQVGASHSSTKISY